MDELKKSIMELRLDEEPVIAEEVPQEFIKEEIKEEKPEVPEEPLKDFWFADLFARVEDVINNQEDVKPWDILDAVWQSVQGTNA